jgi:fibronectin-binding autotransporter adhesin
MTHLFRAACLSVIVLITAARPLVGQTLYWDATAGANNGVGGSATWGTTFSASSIGDAALTTAGPSNPVVFQGSSGVVTLAASQAVASAQFNVSGYTLSSSGPIRTLAGDIALSDGVALKLASEGLKIGSVTGGVGASLLLTGSDVRIYLSPNSTIAASAPVTLAGQAGFIADGGVAIIDASISNSSNLNNAFLGATADSTLIVNGDITGPGSIRFAAGSTGGAGTIVINRSMTIAGTAHFSGDSSGVVKIGVDNALPSASLLLGSMSGFGQTLDLNGHDLTVRNMLNGPGTGAITNDGPGTGVNTLTVTGDLSNNIVHPIRDGATRKTAIRFHPGSTSISTLRISGKHTYTGGTTVSGGNLNLVDENSLSPLGAVLVDGGTLSLSESNAVGLLTLTSGAIFVGGPGGPVLSASSYSVESGWIVGALGGAGVLTKSTAGTVKLSGASIYSGGTTISAGTLNADNTAGSATGTGAVNVAGGTLAGRGAVSGPVTPSAGATIAPGSPDEPAILIESLGTGAVTFDAGSTFQWQLKSEKPLATAADLLDVNGSLTIATGALLNVADLATGRSELYLGDKFSLVRYSLGGWNDVSFDGFADDSVVSIGQVSYLLNYNDVTGGLNFGGGAAGGSYMTLTVTAVPSSADFNDDGQVDGNDFLAWQRGLGSSGRGLHASGDADFDGVIDAADLEVLRNQFGPVSETTAAVAAVPEPAAAALLLAALAQLALRRGRQ